LEDWENIKLILKYLKGTIKYGINISRNSNIKAFVDANHAGDTKTRRSTTGFVITIGDSPTSWCSKLQHCVSTSAAEAEYYSLSEHSKHCMWYTNLLKELKSNDIEVNIDNKAAIYKCKKPIDLSKNKKYGHMIALCKRISKEQ